MKRTLSVISVIALLMSLCAGMLVPATAVTVDANDVDLLAAQEAFGDVTVTTTPDGSVSVTAHSAGNIALNEENGVVMMNNLTGIDLTDTPYMMMSVEADVPFEVIMFDGHHWISFAAEFYATVHPDGEQLTAPPENGLFPSGCYTDCGMRLKELYDRNAADPDQSWDAYWDSTNISIRAIYVKLADVGTVTMHKLVLSAEGGEAELPVVPTTVSTTAATTTVITTAPTVSDPVQGNGDVDGDGEVTMRDAVMLYHFINKKTVLTTEEQARGQIADPYDLLNIVDVITIYHTALGAENAPVESSPTGDRPETTEADAVFMIDVTTGQEIKAAIRMTGVEVLTAFCFRLRYDSDVLRVVSAEELGWMGEMNTADINTRLTNGEVWLGGMNIGATSVVQGEVIATITFETIGDITGEIPVGGIYAQAVDASLQPLVATWAGGTTVDKVVTTTTTTTTRPADSNIVITVETVKHMGTMSAGEQVVVHLSAKANGTVETGNACLRYDKTKLKAVSLEKAGFAAKMALMDMTMVSEKPTTTDPNEGEIKITFFDAKGVPCVGEEVFAVITFEAVTDITEDTVVYLSEAILAAGWSMIYDVTWKDGGVDITDEPFVAPEWPAITTQTVEDSGRDWLPKKESIVITDGVKVVDLARRLVDSRNASDLYMCITSEVPFDIVLNTMDGLPSIRLSELFFTTPDGYIPAGEYRISWSLLEHYRQTTKNPILIDGIGYEPQGEGRFEVSRMYLGNARGDIDGNAAISSTDARMVIRHVVDQESLSDAQRFAADYDLNGYINTGDVRAMLLDITEE